MGMSQGSTGDEILSQADNADAADGAAGEEGQLGELIGRRAQVGEVMARCRGGAGGERVRSLCFVVDGERWNSYSIAILLPPRGRALSIYRS